MAAPMDFCVAVKKEDAQNVRKQLETSGFFDRSRKIQVLTDGEAVIPLKTCSCTEINDVLGGLEHRVLDDAPLPPSRRKQHISPQHRLRTAISRFLDAEEFDEELSRDIPTKWEKHGDLILLPDFCFRSPRWREIHAKVHQQSCESEGQLCQMCGCFWQLVAESLGGTRLARRGSIQDDPYRSPRVELLQGNHGWVEHTDNGIRYTYDVTRCMFSPGNITEKLRVARMDCEGETVVDLYAGIGYFTLPFLVHGKAAEVHACEWNPAAVEALRRNLQLNKVQDRCIVHHGDNREVCPRSVADRVNLGLIPSSRDGWPVACGALRPDTGGILHIHENVTTFPKKGSGSHKTGTQETMATTKSTTSNTCNLKQDSDQHVCTDFEKDSHKSKGASCQHTNLYSCSKIENLLDKFSGNQHLQKGVNESQRCSDKCKHACHEVCCRKEKQAGTSSSDSYEDLQSNEQNTQEGNAEKTDASCSPASQDRQTQKTDVKTRATSVKEEWNCWAESVADNVQSMLMEIQGGTWQTKILHIEHVKSYAPHVDHLVVDLECRPLQTN
ncbi:tRNA wybutosine-synthesizing protein 2 homolog [Branchiostoma floridae x Branchiostoma belcheri]